MKPRQANSVLHVLALVGLFAVAFLAVAQGAETTGTGSNRSGTDSIRLPAHFNHPYFFVTAYLGDEGPFNLLLDTGASWLAISPEVFERLQKKGRASATGSGSGVAASGRAVDLGTARIDSVRLGEVVVRDADAVLFDTSMWSKLVGEATDGLAGLSLFAMGTLVMDYPRGEVWIKKGESRIEPDTVVVPCTFPTQTPKVDLDVGGKRFEVTVDSGSRGGFTLPRAAEKLPRTAPLTTVGMSLGADGLTERTMSRLATNIVWGGVTFEKPVVEILKDGAGLVGTEVLECFAVGVDQPGRRLLLTRATNGPVRSKPVRSFGIPLIPGEEGLKVMSVIPNTDAERAGIRRGDLITAINREPARAWNVKRLSDLKDAAETVEVEMVRDGKPARFRLKVVTLIQ